MDCPCLSSCNALVTCIRRALAFHLHQKVYEVVSYNFILLSVFQVFLESAANVTNGYLEHAVGYVSHAQWLDVRHVNLPGEEVGDALVYESDVRENLLHVRQGPGHDHREEGLQDVHVEGLLAHGAELRVGVLECVGLEDK